MSGGFFAELERQLVEVAGAPLPADAVHPARRRLPANRSPLPSSRRWAAMFGRRAARVGLPAVAATLVAIAIAGVSTLNDGGSSTRRDALSPPLRHALSASRGERSSHRLVTLAGVTDRLPAAAASMLDADAPKQAALTPVAGDPFRSATRTPKEVAPILLGMLTLSGETKSERIAAAIDAVWEGHACSGCYVTDEATLRGVSPKGGRPVRSIAVHVGGGDLKRICVWSIAPDGGSAEGSTCSTNALLTVGGEHSREDAVLTQGFDSSGEEITLAGGT